MRLLLLIYLAFYMLGGAPYIALPGNRAKAQTIPEKTADGIGGGALFEEMQIPVFMADMDIVFEPEARPLYRTLTFSSYTLQRGDMIGAIAMQLGLNEDTLISVNDIRNTRLLQIGHNIRIPNQDGIFHTVQRGDTLESLAERHNVSVYHISVANELFSGAISPNDRLFIPGARMDWITRQEINGDLFIWPATGRITSPFGWRASPFNRARQFHGGIDIAAPPGTPVRAAMSGRVARVGYNSVFGNYIIINHHGGYRTLYAHLSVVRTRTGANVATGERIGDVGNTGLSTGPHLHFEVHKNGVRVNPRTLMR